MLNDMKVYNLKKNIGIIKMFNFDFYWNVAFGHHIFVR